MIRPLVLLALLLAAGPALAAQQLIGSYAVIDLPDGFRESRQFTGALWPEGYASIVVTELPGEAYAKVAEGLLADPAALAGQGILLDTAEETRRGDHDAVIGRGRQRVGGQPYDKWLLLVGAPHVALLVVAQMPTVLADEARQAKIEAALASIRIAAERDDPRDALPFTFGETERFRLLRALSGSAALLTDTAYDGPAPAGALFVIGSSLGTGCDPWRDGEHAFAQQALESLNQVDDLAIETTYKAPVGTDDAVVTEATGTMEGEPVIVVQTLRFRDCAYLRTVGIGPAADRATYRAEFATLAARVAWKPEAATAMPAARNE